jgi:hypothetical protein
MADSSKMTDGTTAGNYSWLLFDDFMRRLFSKNIKGQPNERMAIGGNLWLAGLSQMARLDGSTNFSQGEDRPRDQGDVDQNAFGTLK